MNRLKSGLLMVLLTASMSSRAASCLYGITQCGLNEACVKVDSTKAQCIAHPENLISVTFPLKASAGIFCDQGNLSPDPNSHIYINTGFALDLASDRSKEAGEAVAASDGLAISYSKCASKNDQCGNGFGNYVQILRDDGYLIFYAHLDQVLVKTGERIKEGQKIGIEGNTGWTGNNNRHLHLSVHYDWKNLGIEMLKNNVGWLPPSVPFIMQNTDSRSFKCSRTTGRAEWIKVP